MFPRRTKRQRAKEYMPTMEEIERERDKINASWSEEERQRRTGLMMHDQLPNPIQHVRNFTRRRQNTVDKQQ